MHLREGRVDLALEEFKRAAKEDPKNPYFQKGLGLAYAAKREWKDAIAAFRKALELNPYYVDVRERPRLRRSSGRGTGRAGRRSSWPPSPTPPTRRPRSRPATSARPTSRRRTTPRPSTGSAPASTGTRPTPTPTSSSPTRSWPRAALDEAVAQLEAGVTELPEDADAAARAGQGALQGRALRGGAGRGSRRRCGRTPPARPGAPRRSSSRRCRSRLPCPIAESSRHSSPASRARAPLSSSTPRARSWSGRATSASVSA